MRFIYAILCIFFSSIPSAYANSENATLIADTVIIFENDNISAQGNVEVFYQNRQLYATQLDYNSELDRFFVTGPLTIIDENGIKTGADYGEFQRNFETGLLKTARTILQNQMQIDASNVTLNKGKNALFSQVVATSCVTCENQIPIWRIKAKRVLRDIEKKQLYFYHARFEIFGFPTLYTPYLRVPEPSVRRYHGFLMPKFVSSLRLDLGVKLPYFIPIGQDKDITLIPFISPKTKTLEVRYRQAFRRGNLTVNAAVSSDTLSDDDWRGYLSLRGDVAFKNGYKLNYAIERVTDTAYLGDYGYSGRNGLSSGLSYSKTNSDQHIGTSLGIVQSLYQDDSTSLSLTSNTSYIKVIGKSWAPGRLLYTGELSGNWRSSKDDISGRDLARFANKLSWQSSRINTIGLEYGAKAELNQDIFFANQDSRYDQTSILFSTGTSIFARYPLKAQTKTGSHLIEPIGQISWAYRETGTIVQDESSHVEFDMGNLLSISRYAASDRYENGRHGAIGLRYEYLNQNGTSAGLAFGQAFRDNIGDYSRSSGLKSTTSDMFLMAKFSHPYGFGAEFRGLINTENEPSKSDITTYYSRGKIDLSANYSYLQVDHDEDRNLEIKEWTVSSDYRFNSRWHVSGNFRYDQTQERIARVGGSIKYNNQCVSLGFSADRRYFSESTSPPDTTFNLAISLKGFSTGGNSAPIKQSCNK